MIGSLGYASRFSQAKVNFRLSETFDNYQTALTKKHPETNLLGSAKLGCGENRANPPINRGQT